MTTQEPQFGAQPSSGILLSTPSPLIAATHFNHQQQLLVVTEDRVRLCLNERLGAHRDRNQWHTPVGLLVAIVLAFTTATFRDFGLPKATWEALFVLSGVVSALWSIVAVSKARGAPSQKATVDAIVEDLKRQVKHTQVPPPPPQP